MHLNWNCVVHVGLERHYLVSPVRIKLYLSKLKLFRGLSSTGKILIVYIKFHFKTPELFSCRHPLALPPSPTTSPPQLLVRYPKPGGVSVTRFHACDASFGPPIHKGSALGLFPTLVFCCGGTGIRNESSHHPKAFLADSNRCLAVCSHRLRGYAPISKSTGGTGYQVVKLPNLFMTGGEFELHNRQLPCPLILSLFHSICGFSVGGFGLVQIKNSQSVPDNNCEEHGTHIAQNISPIAVRCLGILNCLFLSSVPQENPPSEKRQKGLVGCA